MKENENQDIVFFKCSGNTIAVCAFSIYVDYKLFYVFVVDMLSCAVEVHMLGRCTFFHWRKQYLQMVVEAKVPICIQWEDEGDIC